jgi:two-component system response regulator FixJ
MEMRPMNNDAIVYLVDDDEDVRRAVAFLLGTAGFAVRVYDSADGMMAAASLKEANCIVSDVRMPGMSGLDLLRALKERGVAVPVVIITGHADVTLAVEAMKAGAADFVDKPFDDESLIAAVKNALTQSPGESSAAAGPVLNRLANLSEREKQILDGLVAGMPNKTIAYDLGLSPRTVEVHRANVMRKMAASSLSELVRMSLLAGRG